MRIFEANQDRSVDSYRGFTCFTLRKLGPGNTIIPNLARLPKLAIRELQILTNNSKNIEELILVRNKFNAIQEALILSNRIQNTEEYMNLKFLTRSYLKKSIIPHMLFDDVKLAIIRTKSGSTTLTLIETSPSARF